MPARMTTLLVATRNAHKLTEIRAILGAPHRCVGLDGLPGAPPLPENAETFEGNAAAKAIALTQWLVSARVALPADPARCYVGAEDSGLEVDALGGAPGVHSARFAALDTGAPGNSTDAANNAKLLRLLQNVPPDQRTARFRCVLALLRPFPAEAIAAPIFFEGVCEGRIGLSPSGTRGFGYDPLFIP
ncbi:MAG: non-canonical purine NTP pyrophosphatase, partial [Verrucomicrobiae bacterium]|nr:non-canonical purine NTP pyrophosphatase [Verrucomicrobiae bacterium]